MKCEPSEDDPFSFEGPEIFKCKGCTINWKEGKNLTVKTVKKKQKHKSKGNVRTITKQVKNDSFFNFFDPPPIPDDPNADIDPETQDLLTADFEIGHYIRDRIIPRAVLFFTGTFFNKFFFYLGKKLFLTLIIATDLKTGTYSIFVKIYKSCTPNFN